MSLRTSSPHLLNTFKVTQLLPWTACSSTRQPLWWRRLSDLNLPWHNLNEECWKTTLDISLKPYQCRRLGDCGGCYHRKSVSQLHIPRQRWAQTFPLSPTSYKIKQGRWSVLESEMIAGKTSFSFSSYYHPVAAMRLNRYGFCFLIVTLYFIDLEMSKKNTH